MELNDFQVVRIHFFLFVQNIKNIPDRALRHFSQTLSNLLPTEPTSFPVTVEAPRVASNPVPAALRTIPPREERAKR